MNRNNTSRRFWLLVAATVIATAVTARLGVWQLSRASEKLALQSAIDHRATLPPLDNRDLGSAPTGPERLHRRVVLRGQWLDPHTVYLDNRQMDGKPGFYVLTPLQFGDERQVVMVQRGWVQRNFNDRASLPVLQSPRGVVQLEGRIAPPPAKLYEFGPGPVGNIRQNLDLAAFAQATGLPLAPYMVLQTGAASDGLARDWPSVDTGVAKHYGYAFQWFALSSLFLLLFIWFHFVRRFFFRR